MSSTGVDAYVQLQNSMKSVCMVYHFPWKRLLEFVEQSDEDISEVVHVMISNPPYNIRQIVELSKRNHDRLSLQDMIHFVELLLVLMDLGGHDHMSRSSLQFKTWYELLIEEVK